MLSPIGYNVITAHNLTASMPPAARLMLAGAARGPQVIPVDVRVRLACDEIVVPVKAGSNATPAFGSRPIGALLDCYM